MRFGATADFGFCLPPTRTSSSIRNPFAGLVHLLYHEYKAFEERINQSTARWSLYITHPIRMNRPHSRLTVHRSTDLSQPHARAGTQSPSGPTVSSPIPNLRSPIPLTQPHRVNAATEENLESVAARFIALNIKPDFVHLALDDIDKSRDLRSQKLAFLTYSKY